MERPQIGCGDTLTLAEPAGWTSRGQGLGDPRWADAGSSVVRIGARLETCGGIGRRIGSRHCRWAWQKGFQNCYTPVEATGHWATGFEASLFLTQSNVSALPGAKGWIAGEKRQAVRIVGWLSPPGRYGHMNLRDHEVLATEISAAS